MCFKGGKMKKIVLFFILAINSCSFATYIPQISYRDVIGLGGIATWNVEQLSPYEKKAGITDGVYPTSQNVGYIFRVDNLSSPVSLSNNAYASLYSITLNKGIWKIYTNIVLSGTPSGGSQFVAGIGTKDGNDGTGLNFPESAIKGIDFPSASTDVTYVNPVAEIPVTATTTYYIKARGVFTSGSLNASAISRVERVK
jgi:hypothetical protein